MMMGVATARRLIDVAAVALPAALADVHDSAAVGEQIALRITTAGLTEALAAALVEGAGFESAVLRRTRSGRFDVDATRGLTLADRVGPGMRLLLVGLNPSIYAAEKGVGFARPGNRFWPAALRAGVVTADRDPRAALRDHGIGMTDLVKRATVGASELGRAEYEHGAQRLSLLVDLLRPRAIAFVGLAGYRAAVDAKAKVGWQPEPFAGMRAYVMPNPSGLNAHTNVEDLARHLRSAVELVRGRSGRDSAR
jgi:TDG/mug DNA glycosylase family protein